MASGITCRNCRVISPADKVVEKQGKCPSCKAPIPGFAVKVSVAQPTRELPPSPIDLEDRKLNTSAEVIHDLIILEEEPVDIILEEKIMDNILKEVPVDFIIIKDGCKHCASFKEVGSDSCLVCNKKFSTQPV